MGDERLEALVVMAGEIVDREASEACAHTSQLVLVNERQVVGGIVDGCEIIVHALAGPVAADLLVPLRAAARQSATVRCNHHIVVCRHDLHVPTVAPELAHRALRATLAEQQCGIFLILVEVGRQDHPILHLLAVGCLHPALLHLAEGELVIEQLVLEG